MAEFFTRDCLSYFDLQGSTPRLEDGIWRLGNSNDHTSDAYDHDCAAKGYQAPDAHTFRLLPRQPLPGWDADFWLRRSLSTAEVWRVLEEKRRADNLPPVGVMGVAADISDGLPYTAYGLDAGGYVTIAISPRAGHYGLGGYPLSRYCQVYSEIEALRFRSDMFDVIIFSGSLALVQEDRLPQVLSSASAALRKNGVLIVTDFENSARSADTLKTLGLRVTLHQAKEKREGWRQRLRRLGHRRVYAPLVVVGRRLT